MSRHRRMVIALVLTVASGCRVQPEAAAEPAITATPAVAAAPTEPPTPAAPSVSAGTPFDQAVGALERWLVAHPEVDRVASWRRGEQFTWVRDATDSLLCAGASCWREAARPELLTMLSYGEDSILPDEYATDSLRLAWGPANGTLEVWDFHPRAGRRQRMGELVARSGEALPFWWKAQQVELQVPGSRMTLSATNPPRFSVAVLQPGGRPGAMLPWSSEPPPAGWSAWVETLEIWPYRSSTGLAALAVTPAARHGEGQQTAVCVRSRSWACAALDRPQDRWSERTPTRAEAIGTGAVAVEIAVFEDEDERQQGTAELHVFALDSGALSRRGALVLGGIEGTRESLGMYRGLIDLDYQFVRRAYQRWDAVGACVRIEPLRGEDIALDDAFAPLSDLEVREWRRRSGGALPKPRRPRPVAAAQAREVVAATAALSPEQRSLAPIEDASGLWKVTEAGLRRAAPDEPCAP